MGKRGKEREKKEDLHPSPHPAQKTHYHLSAPANTPHTVAQIFSSPRITPGRISRTQI